MKVFYVISNICWISGGAEKAALMTLRRLREHYGFECELLSSYAVPYEEWHDGVRLRGFRDVEELKSMARAERPDVIIASLADAVPAFKVAYHFDIPRILSIHSYEFSPPTPIEVQQWQMPEGHRTLPQADIEFVLNSADHIFVCSQHMQRFLRARSKHDSEVLLNDWDEKEVLLDHIGQNGDGRITAICGYRHKGAEIFLDLAKRFPQERFMLVGNPGSDISLRILDAAAVCTNVELPGRMSPRDFLARSKLVLVPSQWPEPFGRIAVEAMINGIPVLASRYGGLCEIVGDGPQGVDAYDSIDAWEGCLRDQLEGRRTEPADIEDGCLRARTFMTAEPIHRLAQVIRLLEAKSAPTWSSTSISFAGGLDGLESHTLVNAAWSREFAARGFGGGTTDNEDQRLSDYVLLHDYSKDFNEFQPTEAGYNIAIRTSDFGPYPRKWVDKIEAEFDQLWVYTEWIAEQARVGGVDPALIRVVPLGVEPDLFRPDGPVSTLIPKDTFTFLFVGGAVRRKGIDILLRAYRKSFSSLDDVTLVIKGDSQNIFYKNHNEVSEVTASGEERGAPRIVHIDKHLTDEELAALYRSCDVGVFPYRAEGFVLPIAEAMASGTPSIVPDFGPCLDFCSESTSFLVPARRIRLPFKQTVSLALGFEMEVDAVDFCEVREEALAQTLRNVFDAGRAGLVDKQQAGLNTARERLSWSSSVDRIETCLRELKQTTPRRLLTSRTAEAKQYQRVMAVHEMAVELTMGRLGDREAT